ncbi:16S rRNA (guanine(527)-N(7))-methyltransferase RsmG [Salsuginibacillus kocurii]|uniref:16S rRNA (guanine(527)-N(7))-methyltransferase RsmG n=1 Tax=Salsuginibacillus kocurii TaxID=427078 RepID=UPI000378E650|nr:16S rRNA (guanine(527)-N(7))-methyltransferase RsmG [Salsuginibacillus kocurii]
MTATETFKQWVEANHLTLSAHQIEQFQVYYETLVSWNEKMNLTGITEENEVYEKHFYDSLTAAFAYDFTQVNKVVDIGAGAGFPSVPLKIIYPHVDIVIVDSLKKRMTFLDHLASKLGISGFRALHSRAEELGKVKEHREQYDLALSRAVARMPVLLELCLPFVKENGMFLAMKGAEGKEERKEGEVAAMQLGGTFEKTYETFLPEEKSERHILRVRKSHKTPAKYPRKPGTPAKKPLS